MSTDVRPELGEATSRSHARLASPEPGVASLSAGAGAAAEAVDEVSFAGGTAHSLGGLFTGRRLAIRVAAFVLGLLVVALAIRGLPGLGDVRARLAAARGTGILAIALLELASVLGFVAALRGAFSSRPPWRVTLELGTAEQAANVLLPAGGVGGLALGTIVARDAGVPSDVAVTRTVALFLVTSSVTFVGIVAGGVLAAPGLGGYPWYGSVLPAALALTTLLVVASLPRVLPAGGRGLRRRLGAGTRAGITVSLQLLREPNVTLLAGAVAYFAFDVAALAAAFHALGAPALAIGPFLLAYTIGQAGGMIPLPGGIGGVDGGLIGMFVLFGSSLDDATAAVLAYRLFQLGVPVLLGVIGIGALGRRRAHHHDPPAVAARFAGLDGG